MRSILRATPRRTAGFTLVELLVVIGIIALLISMLLPSLNRARQAANNVDCMSRMRQIGNAINMYASTYKQMLPPGYGPTPSADFWVKSEQSFPAIISGMLGVKNAELRKLSPVLQDVDIALTTNTWGSNYLNTYYSNSAMFQDFSNMSWIHNTPPKFIPIVKVRPASEVAAVWDAGIVPTSWGGHAFPNVCWIKDTALVNVWWDTRFDSNTNPGSATGKIQSHDVQLTINAGEYNGNPDFRHLTRTSTNLLFLDGHVESRKRGEVYAKDFTFKYR